MKNIVTITFNPAIDKSTSVDRLISEHKMKTTEPVYDAGGGGVNIARALKKLGFASTAVYFEGGETGKFFSGLLSDEEIDTLPVKIAGSTRENFIVAEKLTGRQFRFGLPGPKVSPKEQKELLAKLASIEQIDFLVVSGSLTPGISLGIYKKLKKITDARNAKLVVDTSGNALQHALYSGLYLIKPSLREMASLMGKKQLNINQAIRAARDIISSGKAEIIVISMGNRGAILITETILLSVPAPPVNVVNSVGAGDSMLAGILFSLAKGDDLSSAFRYGVACGSAATLHGGSGLGDKESADNLFKIIQTSNPERP